MAVRVRTDRNGDDWVVRPDGFYQRGHRILKPMTVEEHLGPTVPKPTHGDRRDDGEDGLPVESFADEMRRTHTAAQLFVAADAIAAVRKLAFEIERDPHRIEPHLVPEAIRKALGDV